MNKETRTLVGGAIAVIGGIVMFKNLDEKPTTKEENKATNGLSGIPLSVVGAAIFAVGGYLIFKKD
jgi:hypothetical protein